MLAENIGQIDRQTLFDKDNYVYFLKTICCIEKSDSYTKCSSIISVPTTNWIKKNIERETHF